MTQVGLTHSRSSVSRYQLSSLLLRAQGSDPARSGSPSAVTYPRRSLSLSIRQRDDNGDSLGVVTTVSSTWQCRLNVTFPSILSRPNRKTWFL